MSGVGSWLRSLWPFGRSAVLAKESVCAVVIQRDVDREEVAKDYPGWTVLRAGDPLVGLRFDYVVLLLEKQPGRSVSHLEYEMEREWLKNLHNKMKPGGVIVPGIRVSRK